MNVASERYRQKLTKRMREVTRKTLVELEEMERRDKHGRPGGTRRYNALRAEMAKLERLFDKHLDRKGTRVMIYGGGDRRSVKIARLRG